MCTSLLRYLGLCVCVCFLVCFSRMSNIAWKSQSSRSLPPLNKHTGLNAHSPGVCRMSEVVYVGTEEERVVINRGRVGGRKQEN